MNVSPPPGAGYREEPANGRPRLQPAMVLKGSGLTALLLVVAAWGYLIGLETPNPGAVFSSRNLTHVSEFLGQLAGTSVEHPAYMNPDRWHHALRLAGQTLQMSLLAIGLAGIGMLLTVFAGARSRSDGGFTFKKTIPGRLLFVLIRGLYILARGVPELFWAMFVIFVFQPGILPGALALAVHNFGILGKLCSEVVEDLDPRPIRALRSSGAGGTQILFYAVLPAAAPKFLTYLLYRWEAIIRATIVVGFVSAGGLGREFRLSMNWFHYTEVTLLLVVYFLLVNGVDLISGLLRGLAKWE